MNYSNLVRRIGGGGVDAWKIHSQAVAAATRGEDVIVLSVGDPEFAAPPGHPPRCGSQPTTRVSAARIR